MAEATMPPPPSNRTATGKCEQSTLTGQTPQQPKKSSSKGKGSGKRITLSPMFPCWNAVPGNWSAEEVEALVESMLFHGDSARDWPTHKRDGYWG